MKIVLWIIGVSIGLFILLWLNVIRGTFVRNRRLMKRIGPAVTAVEAGHENASELVRACAKDPATRNDLYERLKVMGKADIFPEEIRTIEKIAESDLVRWLMHPNELQIAPNEIELLRQVAVTEAEKRGRCFLFRFRVEAPHWAADRGWMSGIAGPYWGGDAEPDAGGGTFSELTSYDAMTDGEHVQCLRAAVKKWGLVVPDTLFGGTSALPKHAAWDSLMDIAALTLPEVATGQKPVLLVVHDLGVGDGLGGWLFLDGPDMAGRKSTGIAKVDLLKMDPTLAEIIDLPVGWQASREAPGQAWKRQKS